MTCFDFITQIKRRKRLAQTEAKEEHGKREEKRSFQMAKEEEKREYNEEKEKIEDVEINTSMVEAPDDWRVSERIEKLASVVAWTPSAEHFFRKIMQENEEFDFLNPGNAHHAYYQRRVKVLRMRPCPLYALH